MRSEKLDLILTGGGGAAMIAAGIASFFINGAAVGTISTILAVIALIAGVVLLIARLTEKKNGSPMRFDFVLWLILALLLFNTNILSAIGSVIFFIIALFLIAQGVTNLIGALKAPQTEISKIVFSCLFVVGGVYVLLHSGSVFNDIIGKVVGVYLVIQGANMLRDLVGKLRYERNFKGVE